MDAALVKSVEDELIYKIMNRYESEHIQTLSARRIQDNDGPPTSERLVQDFITNLIDDVSSGAEIAANTESCLGVFKVRTGWEDNGGMKSAEPFVCHPPESLVNSISRILRGYPRHDQ